MGFLEKLNWRYAVKKFNGNLISSESLSQILEAVQMAPSASGLQPYHIIVIRDQKLREKLFEYAKGNPKIINCSHLLIFCARTDFPKRVTDFIAEVKKIRSQTDTDVLLYKESLEKGIEKKIERGVLLEWATRQTYLALGFALAAAAELSVDSGPMEGFDPAGFKEILALPEYMHPQVLMAIGIRDPSDENQPELRKKVRFSKEDLFSFR